MTAPDRFPVLWSWRREERAALERLGCPHDVPWEFVAPHEPQALRNHGQTLARLAERGGLSPAELLAVIEGRGWPRGARDVAAVPALLARLAPSVSVPISGTGGGAP